MSAGTEWEQDLTERGLLPRPWFGDDLEVNRRVDYPDKYRGTLVGCGIGDALGRSVESWSADDIAEVYGTLADYTPTPEGAPAGILTDDSDQTIAIAQSILEHGRVEPRDIADRFAAWRPVGRGIGITTRQSVDAYIAGAPWWKAAVVTAGNGAAMRTAPLGLFHPTDVGALRRDAALAAVVTHGDPMAIASAVAQSFTIAYLLHTEPGRLDISDLLAGLARVIGDIPDAGHPERDGDPDIPVRLLDRLLEMGDRLDEKPRDLFAYTYTGAFVLESLPAALWCFLRSPTDAEKVIVTAVSGGHDTDTVAAMAGALAGAYLGEKSLPERWLDGLEYLDGLERIAERLFTGTGLPGEATPWRDPGIPTNDTYAPVAIGGREYPTLEHVRSAASATDPATAEQIRLIPTPGSARRLAGRPMFPTDDTPVDLEEATARLLALHRRH